jgi:hypothetical protein
VINTGSTLRTARAERQCMLSDVKERLLRAFEKTSANELVVKTNRVIGARIKK